MVDRDEYDLWAESNEEIERKACEVKTLTMLANLDKWMEDSFSYIDNEVQTMEDMENE
jgi:hypothetical protein